MQARPIVDAVEQALADRLIVLRVDILTDPGQEFGRRYNLRLTPTFLLLDSQGQLRFRHDGPLRDRDAFQRAIEQALS